MRYLKGQGTTYAIDEDSWNFYRRTKLSPTSVFRIMKNFADSPERMEAAAKHLHEVDLVGSHNEVNLLWNQKAQEIKQASSSAVDLSRKMSNEDCERWALRKLDQMTEMRERVTTRAKSSGCALEGIHLNTILNSLDPFRPTLPMQPTSQIMVAMPLIPFSSGTRYACVNIPTSLTAYKRPMFVFMPVEEVATHTTLKLS